MSSSVKLEDVREEIDEKAYNRDTHEAAFITYSIIKEVWAGDRLERFLKKHVDDSIPPEEIETVRTSLLRMISLLIAIHWGGWLRFRQIFFLHRDAAKRRDNNIKSLRIEELEHETFLDSNYFARKFVANKWIYIPITLDGYSSTSHDKDTRLPLVWKGDCGKGGYGEVTKEMIPPNHLVLKHLSDHLGLPDQSNSSELLVARKRFPGGRHEAEISSLEFIRSSTSTHNRIVYPLAIVTVGNDLNIIMPCASMDLAEFLAKKYQSMPPPTEKGLLWDLLKESCELAAALEFLHQHLQAKCEWDNLQHQGLCHADFKPENILVFKWGNSSTGIWRISDFGVSRRAVRSLSKERKYDSGLSIVGNPVPPKGGIYEAPDDSAYRRSDVWSFGCILVRILALGLTHGRQSEVDAGRASPVELPSFSKRFYQENPLALNWEVKKWIDDLPGQYSDSYDVSFLAQIQKLLRSMLKINYADRPYTDKVHKDLHALCSMRIKPLPTRSSPPEVTVTIPTPPATPSSSTGTLTTLRTSNDSPSSARTTDQQLDLINLVNNIREGNLDVVEQILHDKSDINLEESYKGNRPLIHAIEEGSSDIIYSLWNYKKDLDVKTPSSEEVAPLHLAVLNGDVDKVKALIDILLNNDPKASLDEPSTAGKTPLMEAAEHGHVAVVSELLKRGADTTITNCVGETQLNCLHYAVMNIESKEDLIEAFKGKMDFDQSPRDLEGYETAMMLHISLGLHGSYGTPKVGNRIWDLWEKKFSVLLAGEADVNRRYPFTSPLQCAIDAKNVRIKDMLLGAGATLSRKEKAKKSEKTSGIEKWRRWVSNY